MTRATILLVEDEPAIRRLMLSALEGQGYRVIEARNGSEALTRFRPEVDLLLVDMRLPCVSGADVIERPRERRRTVKVLAVSGFPMNAPEDVPFLAKPFTRAQLLETVEQVLSSG